MPGWLPRVALALCLLAGPARAALVNYTLTNQEVGWSDSDGKSVCLFFGPMQNGYGLDVELMATPAVPVSVGISQRHECPAAHAVTCGGSSAFVTDSKTGALSFQQSCNVEPGSWVILSTVDLSKQSIVTGTITLNDTDSLQEVFTFRDQPLIGGQCISFGPVGSHTELDIELTTAGNKAIEIRVDEAKECPPKDYTYCGLDKFSMTDSGLDIHTNCNIQAGSWITFYYGTKGDNTTVTGMIYFQRVTRDLNNAIILGGICAAIFLIVIIVGVVVFFCCCSKRRKNAGRTAKGDEVFIPPEDVAPL